jgi:hypothetical protein
MIYISSCENNKKAQSANSIPGFITNQFNEYQLMSNQNPSRVLTIKFNNQKTMPFHRLPFVNPSRGGTSTKFWSLPLQGGYVGGYKAGAAMAEAFLKYLRSHDNDFHGELTSIVGSMMEQFSILEGSRMEDLPISDQSNAYLSFQGQYVGFFNTLTNWLAESVKLFGQSLDQVSERELIERTREGLSKNDNVSSSLQ